MARHARLDPGSVNRKVILPYKPKIDEVERSVSETYRLLHGLNENLRNNGCFFDKNKPGIPKKFLSPGPS